jgi:hypothetical protein
LAAAQEVRERWTWEAKAKQVAEFYRESLRPLAGSERRPS